MGYTQIINDPDVKSYIPLYERLKIAPRYNQTVNMAWYEAMKHNLSDTATKYLVIDALKDVLSEYSQTEPTTKTGGFLRKLASFNWLLNLFKFIRLGKKQ